MEKIGLYFGSFNPIHNGHLSIANYCAENFNLDKVLFVIAKQNPFKSISDYAPMEMRKSMIMASIINNSKLEVCNIEESLPTPSYTYITLRALKELKHETEYYIIMGSDCFESLINWSHSEEILENNFIVFPREGYLDIKSKQKEYEKKIGHQINILEGQSDVINNISSSFIRKCISNKHKIVGYVPNEVIKIIEDNKIYK